MKDWWEYEGLTRWWLRRGWPAYGWVLAFVPLVLGALIVWLAS